MDVESRSASRDDRFVISTDPARLDVDVIHSYLTRSYWSPGVSRATVEAAIRGSLCFGLYDRDRQIGYARVVTDGATFAYLADVFVLEEYRGDGLGEWLVETAVSHDAVRDVRRFMLATRDAHGLYERFGFRPMANPGRFMERVR